MSSYLTKYLLRDFNACPTLFYQKYHHPESFPSAKDFSALQGHEFEKMVKRCARFAKLQEVQWTQSDTDALKQTQAAIAAGASLLSEASFSVEGLFLRADIIAIHGQEITLYEIKTKAQEIYLENGNLNANYLTDVSFQYYLLKKAGYSLKKVYLCHPKAEFQRHGEIDPDEFVAFDDVTSQCRNQEEEIKKEIAAAFLCANEETRPEHHFNAACSTCPLEQSCFDDFGADNISLLMGANYGKKEKLARENIHTLADLSSHPEQIKKNTKAALQIAAIREGGKRVDVPAIQAFMAQLGYPEHPLYFLDFETLQPCIPDFDGFHASEIYPTQYSLHKLAKDYGPLTHQEFLGDGIHDPRRALAEQLCHDLQEPGKILIYNKSMEPNRVEDLARIFPDLPELAPIQEEMVDLMDIFSDLDYYEKAFGNRWTIKIVLPTLCPNDPTLDYHALPGSQNGNDAQINYYRLRNLSPQESQSVRKGLLVYCHLDTFAEIKIWLRLLKEIGDPQAAKIETIVSTYLKNRQNE
jgi:hypothetical protein